MTKKVAIVFLIFSFFCVPQLYADAEYDYESLDSYFTSISSAAFDINDSSPICGTYDPSAPINNNRAFFFDPSASSGNEFQNLGVLSGGRYSYAYGLNNSGTVVGLSTTLVSTTERQHAFIWDTTNNMQDLGVLPTGVTSAGQDINNNNLIAGNANIQSGGYKNRATQWDASTLSSPDDPQNLGVYSNYTSSSARGLNDDGDIVGQSSNNFRVDAIIYDSSSQAINALDHLASTRPYSRAQAINNTGTIVGRSQNTSAKNQAVYWDTNYDVSLLGSLGGDESEALDINNNGQIIGKAKNADGFYQPFFWEEDRGMVDFCSLLSEDDQSTISYLNLYGINNLGEIVGYGQIGGKTQALVFKPTTVVPEPISALLFIFGGAFLGFARKFRS